ncbi:MAG: DUF6273 domain-containing protein [Candidatus Cloacimonetes bacterium]|nr:DUF6273 domain-containing protein [Candidatus Cloacimonadota bacterium]
MSFTNSENKIEIGSVIPFGDEMWRVLDVKSDRILIICTRIIEQKKYHESSGDVTWANCDLRKFLNTEYYESFKEDDKSRIISVNNSNEPNSKYQTQSGRATDDKIFLLSESEAKKYFSDDKDRGLPESFSDDDYQGWWLRTRGESEGQAMVVINFFAEEEDGSQAEDEEGNPIVPGYIFHEGTYTGTDSVKTGVRPAMWLRL